MRLGMSIAAPGGETRGLDTKAFYEFLERRGEAIITVPADRWTADAYHGTAPGKMLTVHTCPFRSVVDFLTYGTGRPKADLSLNSPSGIHKSLESLVLKLHK